MRIPEEFSLFLHLQRQREFSERTFGPGTRTAGVVDHIRKELREIESDPTDISEWIDVVILALDGAWRAGHSPSGIIEALEAKQMKNEARTWPDWRTANPDKAIEHVKEVTKRSCNRHEDCDAAEAEVLTRHPGKTRADISFSFHCHDEGCEDCFGS